MGRDRVKLATFNSPQSTQKQTFGSLDWVAGPTVGR